MGAGERLSAIAGDHPLFVLLFVIADLKQIYPEFSQDVDINPLQISIITFPID